jgi:16S rRNA (guanine966-N2)-methyltransferase
MARKKVARAGRRNGGSPIPQRGEQAPSCGPTEPSSPPRIIGGELRGRRLAFQPGGPTRPMKDRVRETVFDLLGTDVRGATAIDLFAGTGAIGFEAISRGAKRGIFAERHFPTVACLRRSAVDLGLKGCVEIIPGDVLLWPKRFPPLPDDAPWLTFVSPPWEMFQTHFGEINRLLEAVANTAPAGSRLIVEAEIRPTANQLPDQLTQRPTETPWDIRPLPPAILFQKNL